MPTLHSYRRIAMMVSLAALTGVTALIPPTFLAGESGPSAGAYAFVLFSPGSRGAEMSGSMEDVRRAMSLRADSEGFLLRSSGRFRYVIRDAAALRRAALREELRSFRVKLGGGFGGLLFPSESDPAIPLRRDVLAKWLQQAERRAGLKKLDGSLWHAYRRAWATSRKELPIADVAAAGGWSDVATLLRCS